MRDDGRRVDQHGFPASDSVGNDARERARRLWPGNPHLSRVPPSSAVVVGATGGLGRALVEALAASGRYSAVHALARGTQDVRDGVTFGCIDILEEDSVAAAAARIEGQVGLVVVASGVLHDARARPEKTYRALEADALAHVLAANAIGPALVAKHFLPLLPKQDKAVFAAISARVGSIGDNRLGGWYAYRASKAALNMLIKTLAIELARQKPDAICIALHPGTVNTGLSAPYQGNVRAGKLFTPAFSAARMLDVIDNATVAESGACLAWDGTVVPP